MVKINQSEFEAILEVLLLRGGDFDDHASCLTTTYQTVDAKNVEFRAVLMNPKKKFAQVKRQPKPLAASFLAGHKVYLERAFTKSVMAQKRKTGSVELPLPTRRVPVCKALTEVLMEASEL